MHTSMYTCFNCSRSFSCSCEPLLESIGIHGFCQNAWIWRERRGPMALCLGFPHKGSKYLFFREGLQAASSICFEYLFPQRNLQLDHRQFEKLSEETPCQALHRAAVHWLVIEFSSRPRLMRRCLWQRSKRILSMNRTHEEEFLTEEHRLHYVVCVNF